MKVAFFTNNFPPRLSGVAISVNSLKIYLEKMGVKVIVFAPNYQGFNNSRKESGIIRIRSLRFWWLKRFALPLPFFNVRKINRALIQFQPDLIHFHQPFLLGRVALKRGIKQKIPVVFTYHSLYENYIHYFPFNQKVCRKMAHYYTVNSADRSNLVITPTALIANYLKEKGVTSRIAIVPTGIDFKRYKQRFSLGEINKFKKELGIDSHQKILLYVGRLMPEKNIDFLLEVARKILRLRKDIVLVVVGDGTLLSSGRGLTRKLKLDQQILWMGSQKPNKLPYFYQSADLFLFPSKTDTQAIVIYEALASGLPVIAVKSLASEAVIKEGENGFLVPEDIDEFSKTVLSNLNFKNKKIILLAEEQYAPAQIAEKIHHLYQKVISEQSFLKKKFPTFFHTSESFKY